MPSPGSWDNGGSRLASLERDYGPFDVVDAKAVVPRAVYTDCLRASEAGMLGGARVFLWRDGQVLLVRYGDKPDTWDLPGGPADRGESLEDAAKFRVHEDVGVTCSITGVDRVIEQTFALVDGGDGVTGYWVFFEAETDDEVSKADDVLEARWFDPANPPEPIGPHVRDRLEDH